MEDDERDGIDEGMASADGDEFEHGFEPFDQEESLLDPNVEPDPGPDVEAEAEAESAPPSLNPAASGPGEVAVGEVEPQIQSPQTQTPQIQTPQTQPRPDVAPPPLALYRRYRPDTFDDLIGQDHVTEPLKRALVNNRVNHAYLFSGPRGCGKTTSARILARSLNCEQGPTPNPCGTCLSCRDLARGGPGSIDVIEIDAASHGGVDDARDLRERAFFAPVHSRYKVYIVDEAHMVTPAGFNAMLKLVEEPPPHVKFIFATTEPEKVIGTIRSRTHHYPFRLVPPKLLSDYLGTLCQAENITVEPAVLPLVVRAGAGSVRDSLSVLDQLLGGSSEGGVSYSQATGLLGYTPDSLLDEILDAFAAGDAAGVFAAVDKVVEVGQDPRRFAEDLLRRLRDLVIVAAVPDAIASGLVAAADDQAERLRSQASAMGAGELTRAAEVIALGLTEMRGTTAPRLYLELMCARVLLPGADVDGRGTHARLDRLEKRLDMVGTAPSNTPAPSKPATESNSSASSATQGSVPARDAAAAEPTRPADPDTAPPSSRPAGQESTTGAVARAQSAPVGSAGVPEQSRPAESATPGAGSPQPMPPTKQSSAGPTASEAQSSQPQSPESHNSVSQNSVSQNSAIQSSAPEIPEPEDEQAPPPPPEDVPPTATSAPSATEAAAPVGSGATGGLNTAGVRQRWPEVIEELGRRKKMTWILVSQNAHVSEVSNGQLTLGFHNAGAMESFGRSGHSGHAGHPDILAEALIEVFGADLRVTTILDEAGPSASPKGEAAPGAAAPDNQARNTTGDTTRTGAARPPAGVDPWDRPPPPVSGAPSPDPASPAPDPTGTHDPAGTSGEQRVAAGQRADTVPASPASAEAGQRARQGIRRTRTGGAAEPEPEDERNLPDRSDSDVEDLGESHTELLARHLGAEYIGEVENT